MKKCMSILLVIAVLLSLTACQSKQDKGEKIPPVQTETRVFTDSLGREVTVPVQINKVALSGPMAQIVLFALCPDKLVGIANSWNDDSDLFLSPEHFNLPVIGQLYGGKGALNLETLLAAGAQIIIDVGEPKDGMAEDLDALQEQTGIPVVHISAHTATAGDAFRALGDLLYMEAEAEVLADYCDRVYQQTVEISQRVDKANLLYVTGDSGQNVIAKGAYHAEIIDLLSNNLAVVDTPSAQGTGNEVGMEQILLWNPDVILFSPESCYETVAADPAWQEVKAIQTGNYYEVPFGVYNWMGFPPSVQRCPGMLWMSSLLYPDAADYDLYEAVAEYYDLFYHCRLTKELYDALVANSIGKRAAQ